LVRYNYPVHRTRSLKDALKLAMRLRDAGDYDLFRGQSHNFAPIPSIFRGGDRTLAIQRLEQFHSWLGERPELSSLHGNRDAVLAVAQHYGIPTPLLDFTTEPSIAAFFAQCGERVPRGEKRTGTIICGSRKQIRDSWADLNARHRTRAEGDLVRIVEIDVRNLWRLKAQHGLFLDVRVDENMFVMFTYLLHIEFPLKPVPEPEGYELIYPANKSHLELLLDQYFLVETYPEREKRLLEMFGAKIEVGDSRFIGEASSFRDAAFPPIHSSWSKECLDRWQHEPDEPHLANPGAGHEILRIDEKADLETTLETLKAQMSGLLGRTPSPRSLQLSWSVRDSGGREALDLHEEVDAGDERSSLAKYVRIIFDGMRTKPYTDENIAIAIATYVCLARFRGWEAMKSLWAGGPLGIEMDGASVRSRGFCGRTALAKALVPEFASYLVQAEAEAFREQSVELALAVLIDPQRMFVFEKFKDLFAEQVVPSIVQMRIEGDVFHFNPVSLRVFGLS